MEAFWDTLRSDVHFGILILASLFGTVGNTFRGLRWQLLNRRVNPHISPINSILAVHGNYLVNLAFPRIGELWRVGVVAHYEHVSFSKLLGTLFADRLVDIATLVLMFLLALVLNTPFFLSLADAHPEVLARFTSLVSTPLFYLFVAVGVLTVIGLVLWFRKSSRKETLLHNVTEGLSSITTMPERGLFLLYTLAIWVSYFLQFYIAFYAFSFTQWLGMSVALLTFVVGSLGLLVPTQGGLGGWHLMVIYALATFGVSMPEAQSFALIVHTFQALIWTGVVGGVAMLLLPLVNSKKKTDRINQI